jgi:tetratricopeptide (TPR) repeat protein
VRDNLGFTLAPARRTLATRLKEAGFKTGAAVSAYVLRSQTGIAQGFDVFDDALQIAPTENLGLLQRDGALSVEALGRFVGAQPGGRVFAFLHLYEPHTPYTPPEGYRDLPNPYDGEIAYADELVRRFLASLPKAVADQTIVALTADHGEGLNDHGEAEHGIFLYREELHVPLILRLPDGARAGTRVRGIASQSDIAPTLLDLLGLSADGMDGVSLRAAALKGTTDARPSYAETLFPRYHFGWSDLYAVTEPRFRYIRAPREELYDVAQDPGERQDVSRAHPEAASAMRAWLAKEVDVTKVQPMEAVSEDTKGKLGALGYIGLAPEAQVEAADLPDPKDKIGSYEDLKRANSLREGGKLEDAVAVLKGVLRDNPRMVDGWETLAGILGSLGRTEEAIGALQKILEIDPTHSQSHIDLARVYALSGRTDLAVRHAELASARDPGAGFETLAELMLDKDRPDQAREYARRSLAQDKDRAMSHFVLGLLAQRAGRCEEAVPDFQQAEASNARRTASVILDLHYDLGDCLARLGRNDEAEAEFQKEVKTFPRGSKARVGLALLYRSLGRDQEARNALSGVVTQDPHPGPDGYWTVVHTFGILGDSQAAAEWRDRARALFPTDPRFR